MSRTTEANVFMKDLIMAYRKAKVDTFYETGHRTREKFAEYEKRLHKNLKTLEEKIDKREVSWFKRKSFVGDYIFTLKSVKIDSTLNPDNNFFFSSHQKNNKRIEDLDFRIIGDHSVDFHILSSLWIDKVGVYLESKISKNSYGCRLNFSIPIDDENIHTLDRKEVFSGYKHGHFRSYLIDYQNWQQNGISETKKAIDEGKKVIAITADFKKYYHRIDCSFLTSQEFLDYIDIQELTPIQQKLTELLITAYNAWNDCASKKDVPEDFKSNGRIGIPMGLSSSRVIANILLAHLDKEIENKVPYIYYGRYVDDLFFVIEDKGMINKPEDFWKYLHNLIPSIKPVHDSKNESDFKKGTHSYKIDVPYSLQSFIEFSPGKERFFCLEGISGGAFLNTLKESLDENSSEWNMPPNVEGDLESFSAEMTSASGNTKESANGLRKADGISIQRLKFILYLKRFELAIELLPKKCWSTPIESFLSLAAEYAIIPENLAIYSKYFPRLLSLAINSGKFQHGKKLLENIKNGFDYLILMVSKDPKLSHKTDLIKSSKQHQLNLLIEGIYTSIDPFAIRTLKNEEFKALIVDLELQIDIILPIVKDLFFSDLHRIAFKNYFLYPEKFTDWVPDTWRIKWFFEFEENFKESLNYNNAKLLYTKIVSLEETKNVDKEIPNSLYFYTRPFSLLELSLLIPDWYNDLDDFRKICKIYGYSNFGSIINGFDESIGVPNLIPISIPSFNSDSDKVFALTSLETKNASWVAVVRDEVNDPDSDRNQRILDLSGDIIKCKLRKKDSAVDYVVFPELSIPRNLILYLSFLFKNKNISIIAGLEYKNNVPDPLNLPKSFVGEVFNQLIYILCTGKKELPQQIALIQDKTIPAIHEESELFRVGGKILAARNEHKFLIEHGNFWFSGLICNDVLNINYRASLRGLIDALIVIEWNPDTETYDHLVSSSANDLHSFIIQVNNRYYGDTRLRGPYKKDYERDKVRVRGGELDYFVVATLEVKKLREFQRDHRSPEKPFKPTPTGFEMSDERRNS